MTRKENIRESLKLIKQANARIYRALRNHKKLPCELFIAVNASVRIINNEAVRIRGQVGGIK